MRYNRYTRGTRGTDRNTLRFKQEFQAVLRPGSALEFNVEIAGDKFYIQDSNENEVYKGDKINKILC